MASEAGEVVSSWPVGVERRRRLPLWRRACRVLADEGVGGVTRRLRGEAKPDLALLADAKKDYEQRLADFQGASGRIGEDLSRFYWYHTVDLGDGLVTPGDYDYRGFVSAYQFPADMRGMTVLDVGSATGFFAFEFERRGASVVSVELPSIADWDMPPGPDRDQTIRELMATHGVSTVEELHHLHIEGPFQFCRQRLGSKVTRCYSKIYNLTPEKLGHKSFDMIFIGDVLLHTFSPLMALSVLAPLCSGRVIIAQQSPNVCREKPVMVYTGGDGRGLTDNRTWWHPNRLCLEQMLKRLGFRDVRVMAEHPPFVVRGKWLIDDHAIFHATK